MTADELELAMQTLIPRKTARRTTDVVCLIGGDWVPIDHVMAVHSLPTGPTRLALVPADRTIHVDTTRTQATGISQWQCEECRTPWANVGQPQCHICGNRTRTPREG